MNKALFILFILLFSIIPANNNSLPSNENTLYVGGSGAGNYSKIQDAINAAMSGYTIVVYPGIYKENIIINKSIKLIGMERDKTIIDGCKKGFVVRIIANHVTIKNFTIRNSSYSHAAIYVTSNQNLIIGNKIEYANGISFYKSSFNTVEDNVFIHLNGSYPCSAIFMKYSSNNSIFKNKMEGDVGINAFSSWNSSIYENEIYNSFGIICEECSNFDIEMNTIRNGHMAGIEIALSKNVKVINNRIYNITGILERNGISGPVGVAILVGYSYDVMVGGNYIDYTNFSGIASLYSDETCIFNNTILNIYGEMNSSSGVSPISVGVAVEFCNKSMIEGNKIRNVNFVGIYAALSRDNKIYGNELLNITGYENLGENYTAIATGMAFISSQNNEIEKNKMERCDNGIISFLSPYGNIDANLFQNISGYDIVNNKTKETSFVIFLFHSNNYNISYNKIYNGFVSISSYFSSNCTLYKNEIRNDEIKEVGIFYSHSKGKILDNVVENNIVGIFLFLSSGDKIEGNSMKNLVNMYLMKSNRNSIKENAFQKVILQAFFLDSSFNIWFHNYWSNWHIFLPKPIFGVKIFRGIPIPWMNFDFMPLQNKPLYNGNPLISFQFPISQLYCHNIFLNSLLFNIPYGSNL